MARLWSCGFELRQSVANLEYDTTSGTAPSVSTTTVRSGTTALRFNPTSATSYIQHRYRVDSTARIFYRMYFRFATLPDADCSILAHTDATTVFPEVRFLVASNTLQVRASGTTLVGGTSAAITTGVWYRLELDYDDANASNLTSAWLDGELFCNAQNGGDMAAAGLIRMGICTAASADMFIDDVAVNDGSGTAQTGLPGPGQIVHLFPNATGASNTFETAVGGTAGAANAWTRLNQVPISDSSYNQTAVAGTTATDDMNAQDATGTISSAANIAVVQVGQRAGSNATTTASIVTRLTASQIADNFNRTLSATWGSTDTGDLYSYVGGSSADYSVNGSAGLMSAASVNVSRWTTVSTWASATVDVKVKISTDALATGGSHFAHIAGRMVDANNNYMARLAFNTDQSLTLTLRKRVATVETLLATDATIGSLTHAANTVFWVRFSISGTTLSAKCWADGTAEPGSFGVTVTDASFSAAGLIGLRTILASGNTNTLPVSYAYDGFQTIGTTTESASIPVNTTTFSTHATATPKIYKITAYTNPQGGAAWKLGSLDTMQIGYRSNVSQTTQRRVAALWALVDYLEPINTDGTSAGVGDTSGTSAADRSVAGTSVGVGGSTGVLGIEQAAAGTSAGVGASTGPLGLIQAAAGTSAGVESSTGTAALAMAVSGTSAGVEASTGTASKTTSVDGTSAGIESSTGSTTYSTTASGTSAGTGGSTGSLVGVRAVSGTSAGVEASTGATVYTGAAAGTSAGTGSTTGTAVGGGDSAGTSAGVGGSTGSSSKITSASGTSAGVESSTGSLTYTAAATGTSAGTGSSTGTAALNVSTAGTSVGVESSTGTAFRVTAVAGTSAGVEASTGTLAKTAVATGTSAGIGATTGSLVNNVSVSSTSPGTGATTGTVLGGSDSTGTSTGVGGSTGGLLLTRAAAGTSAGLGASTGTAAVVTSTTGTSPGTGATTGTTAGGGDVVGTSAGIGASTGSPIALRDLVAAANGLGGTTGLLSVTRAANDTSTGTGSSTGSTTAIRPASGTSSATGGTAGLLTVVPPLGLTNSPTPWQVSASRSQAELVSVSRASQHVQVSETRPEPITSGGQGVADL